MPLSVVLAAAAVASAVPIAWVAVASRRSPAAIGPVTDLHQLELAQSAVTRVVRPVAATLARRARALTPGAWIERLERKIALAGKAHSITVEGVLAIKVVLGVLPGAAALVLRPTDPMIWFLVVMGTAVLYFIPDAYLDGKARERELAIQRRLPDMLDQLTMSVEAGLGFEAALAKAAKSSGGPLAAECIRTLQEMQLGSPRRDALKALATRTEVPDVRTFVFSVNQAETYGIPIADILRLQASELRKRRHMRAEEAALKIPIKILFPLAFCIFPTLFIVLLAPAGIRIFDTL